LPRRWRAIRSASGRGTTARSKNSPQVGHLPRLSMGSMCPQARHTRTSSTGATLFRDARCKRVILFAVHTADYLTRIAVEAPGAMTTAGVPRLSQPGLGRLGDGGGRCRFPHPLALRTLRIQAPHRSRLCQLAIKLQRALGDADPTEIALDTCTGIPTHLPHRCRVI
jgi:hypothetical protein